MRSLPSLSPANKLTVVPPVQKGDATPYSSLRQGYVLSFTHHPKACHTHTPTHWKVVWGGCRPPLKSGVGQLRTHPREAAGVRTTREPSLQRLLAHAPLSYWTSLTNSKMKLLRILRQRLQCPSCNQGTLLSVSLCATVLVTHT